MVDHNQNIIEIANISFTYENDIKVLEDVSLNIHKGDYIGLVGPNGSGKTTLLKIILGLIKAQSGSIKIFGEDISNFKEWNKVGYVSQKIMNFEKNFPITVLEVVKLNLLEHSNLFTGLSKKKYQDIEQVLREVGMWEYRNRLIGDLSGGQMQRVFIAKALVNKPEIIFLDEPTAGVDKKSQDDFYNLLQRLNKEQNITLVMVSHDIERLTKEVMHMVCVNRTLTCHTTPEDFIKDSQITNLFGENVRIITHHEHK